MDLWNSLKKIHAKDLGVSALSLSTGARAHTSMSMIEGVAVELKPNSIAFKKYSDNGRYLIAKDLTFDMLVTVYDVNNRGIVAGRISKIPDVGELAKIRSLIGKLGGSSNLEFRAIGLQNGYLDTISSLDSIYKFGKIRLMEADLFGTDVRHVAIDTKTGVPYNILLLNRIYRAGELICQIEEADFKSKQTGSLAFS